MKTSAYIWGAFLLTASFCPSAYEPCDKKLAQAFMLDAVSDVYRHAEVLRRVRTGELASATALLELIITGDRAELEGLLHSELLEKSEKDKITKALSYSDGAIDKAIGSSQGSAEGEEQLASRPTCR